jgi:hypothetical protein
MVHFSRLVSCPGYCSRHLLASCWRRLTHSGRVWLPRKRQKESGLFQANESGGQHLPRSL